MKNSIIICEGGTDGTLLQYFMEKVNGWVYSKEKPKLTHRRGGKQAGKPEWSHVLTKSGDKLTIQAAGTCDELVPVMKKVLNTNKLIGNPEEKYDNIVILTDHDETGSDSAFPAKIQDTLAEYNVTHQGNLVNNQWKECSMTMSTGETIAFRVLVMVIPFDGQGALETFLLNAIAKDSAKGNSYDKAIIDKGNAFVDAIDPQDRYLHKRRYKVKAKFDVYFSIRTAADQFTERQNILRGIPWEDYTQIQRDFAQLGAI